MRLPSRISSTSSQSGTLRSSRSTSAVPTNPVTPVMAIRFPESDAAITVDSSSTFVYQLVERCSESSDRVAVGRVNELAEGARSRDDAMRSRSASTRERILDCSIDLFGTKGVDAVSLDEIAAARRRPQADRPLLVRLEGRPRRRVLESVAAQLLVVIDAAVRAGDGRSAREDRRRRAGRVPPGGASARAARSGARDEPAQPGARRPAPRPDQSADRPRDVAISATRWTGRLRRGDPGLVAALAYATVTGIATEPRGVGPTPSVGFPTSCAGLRRLRDEIRSFLRRRSSHWMPECAAWLSARRRRRCHRRAIRRRDRRSRRAGCGRRRTPGRT